MGGCGGEPQTIAPAIYLLTPHLMPKLRQSKLVEITLPTSGAICKIGFTYGDRLKLQDMLLEGSTINIGTDGKSEQSHQITVKQVGERTQSLVEMGLRSWDMQEEDGKIADVTWENILLLPPEDGVYLNKQLEKIVSADLSDEAKKE